MVMNSVLFGISVLIIHFALKNHIHEVHLRGAPSPSSRPTEPPLTSSRAMYPAAAPPVHATIVPADDEAAFLEFIMADSSASEGVAVVSPALKGASPPSPPSPPSQPHPRPMSDLAPQALAQAHVNQEDQGGMVNMVVGKYSNESAMCGGSVFGGLHGFNPHDPGFSLLTEESSAAAGVV